jgi:formylglycine-generating enzyme required for sulfatase activity/serine/threonine protein kinase
MVTPLAHPSDPILYAYGLGKLDEASCMAVDSHLEGCDACRRRVSELSGDSFVGRLRDAGGKHEAPAPAVPPVPPSPGGTKPPAPDPALARTLPPELANNPEYTILRELGRGGMGVLYLAHNTTLDRREVLKVLNKEMLERRGTYERFLREMRAAAKLNHPNVVMAHAARQWGNLLVFAMEYIDGQDLAKLVKARGKLPVPLACSFVRQAALGLQHAHEKGLVHRDIKPGNLMYTQQDRVGLRAAKARPFEPTWTVKILDFGLAKATSENPVDGSLTREGQMLGTLDYIAPEQSFNAQKADIRADIYSLGCTLYHLLTGTPPFDGPGAGAILQAHFSIDALPLNLARPEVPVELAAVVAKMMAKEPARRYQTPVEVAEALRPFCNKGKLGSGSADGESSQAQRPESRAVDSAVVAPAPAPAPAPQPAGAAPGTVPGAAKMPDDPSLMWKSLITVPEPEHLADLKKPTAAAQWRWPPRVVLWGAGALVLLLAVIFAWAAGLLTIKTREGLLVLEGVQATKPIPLQRRPVEPTPARVEPSKTITNTIGMKLVLIPAGEFLMGSPDDDKRAPANERPQHRVRITRPFYLGVTEVTRGQFRRFVDETGYRTEGEQDGKGAAGWNPEAKAWKPNNPKFTWRECGFKQTDEHPVVDVSWKDAVEFAAWLSRKERQTYRLPTEAEWEYACRANSPPLRPPGEYARHIDNPVVRSQPVDQFSPNAWGLQGMLGNVDEWCADGFDVAYYGSSPAVDPPGPARYTARVRRGSNFYDNGPLCARPAYRRGTEPSWREDLLGFRVALDLSGTNRESINTSSEPGSTTGTNLKLGPSNDFRADVALLQKDEKLIGPGPPKSAGVPKARAKNDRKAGRS